MSAYGGQSQSSGRNHGPVQARMAAKMMLGSAGEEWEGHIGMVSNVKTKAYEDRYMRMADGALQFYKMVGATPSSKPLKQYPIRDIRSIRWSGVEITTPLETFKLHESSRAENHGMSHKMFKATKEFCDSRQVEPTLVHGFVPGQGLGGCMAVGELGDGRVLYRPQEGHSQEEMDKDVLRLSLAINLVKDEEKKKTVDFHGYVQKSAKTSARDKERYLKVERGHFNFFDSDMQKDGPGAKPRKMFGIDTISRCRLLQLTIELDYETIRLCNTKLEPLSLHMMITKLEAAFNLLHGNVAANFAKVRTVRPSARRSTSGMPLAARGGRGAGCVRLQLARLTACSPHGAMACVVPC
jgi:hypothetical protein